MTTEELVFLLEVLEIILQETSGAFVDLYCLQLRSKKQKGLGPI